MNTRKLSLVGLRIRAKHKRRSKLNHYQMRRGESAPQMWKAAGEMEGKERKCQRLGHAGNSTTSQTHLQTQTSVKNLPKE